MRTGNTGKSNHRRRFRVIGAAFISVVVLPNSCSTSAAPGPPLPPAPPVVVVAMTEFRFEYGQVIPSGRVVFRFMNQGAEQHRPTLKPLPEDMPPIEEQLRGSERRASVPFADVGTLGPG